jgi:hypothetical protein
MFYKLYTILFFFIFTKFSKKLKLFFILKNYFNKFNIKVKAKLKSKVKTIKEWKPLEYLLD